MTQWNYAKLERLIFHKRSDVSLVDGAKSLVRKEVSRTAQDIKTLCCLFGNTCDVL